MNRGNFFKALATVIFAPSILKGINWGEQKGEYVYDSVLLKDALSATPPEWAEKYQLVKTENECNGYFVDETRGHQIRFSSEHRMGVFYYDNGQWSKVRQYAYNNKA